MHAALGGDAPPISPSTGYVEPSGSVLSTYRVDDGLALAELAREKKREAFEALCAVAGAPPGFLPVYALLIAAFVPARATLGPLGLQGLTLLGLYLLGALSALAVAAVLRRTVLPGEGLPFTLELPPYRRPTLRLWAGQVWESVWAFLRRAGTIILGVSVVLWILLHVPASQPARGASDAEARSAALEQSLAGRRINFQTVV